MSKPIIACQDVTFFYEEGDDRAQALQKVNCTIQPGEFVAIIGTNGSGKSTLAKLFNALLIPSLGDVVVNGLNTKDEKRLWDVRQAVGMVFQNPDNQIVATIVEEDIAFGPENLGIPSEEIRTRVDGALQAVNMQSYQRHAPHLLSGGQKQKVAIAGVLAMRPKAIVLDEPTAMLDPIGRKEVINTIHELNKQEGITIVLITHYMSEVVNADRVLVMNEGQIVMEGSPREIFLRSAELTEVGLDVPQITELANVLSQDGLPISRQITTVEEMVDELCRL